MPYASGSTRLISSQNTTSIFLSPCKAFFGTKLNSLRAPLRNSQCSLNSRATSEALVPAAQANAARAYKRLVRRQRVVAGHRFCRTGRAAQQRTAPSPTESFYESFVSRRIRRRHYGVEIGLLRQRHSTFPGLPEVRRARASYIQADDTVCTIIGLRCRFVEQVTQLISFIIIHSSRTTPEQRA